MSSLINRRGSSLRFAADSFRTSVTNDIASSLDSITESCLALSFGIAELLNTVSVAAFAQGISSIKRRQAQLSAIAQSRPPDALCG